MKVVVLNQQKDLPIRALSVKPIVKEVLATENLFTDEVTIYFVTTKEICKLRQDFFSDSSTTDCISFPMDEEGEKSSGYHILGEIFICPKTALDYMQSPQVEQTGDVYGEITLYLVHGLLHLIGYDDVEEKKRKKMRAAEARHMEHLLNKRLLLKGK